ncbi:MAG TPA: hypothetical protein VFQ77_11205 [Pseudonocardiaceae bacterium]|jgi:Mce-associated membrane protein|nr:hypothetical protein [Pseudonocardiaceae bacterium]
MGTGGPRTRVVALVALLAALLAGCAHQRSAEVPAPARPANLAFVDIEASRAVSDQITPAVARFFSYDYRWLDAHFSQLRSDSTARFWSEQEPSLGVVREVVARKQVVGTAKVVATSLHVLEPGRAELLLFVDRRITQAGGPAQEVNSSVLITAARVGPNWKLDGMAVL